MGKKTSYKRLKGSQSLRQRLVLSTLASTPVLIDDIRADDTMPGLRPHEISLLRLLERICDDCVVEINETGEFFIIIFIFSLKICAFGFLNFLIIKFLFTY